jgi:hypothetical protein
MPRRPGKKGAAPIEVTAPKGNRRILGTDSFATNARDQSLLTPEGFKKRTTIDMEQALRDLGPTIRSMALDDSNGELLVAWGRCAEKRLGMALFIEDTIRAMTPADCAIWRANICRAALDQWYQPTTDAELVPKKARRPARG